MNCVFCEIVAGRLPARKVAEDDEHVAFLPLEMIEAGHLLLVPKHHVDYVFDMAQDEYRRLWDAAARIAHPLREATGAKRIGIAVEGFSVPHVHVHLVPINALNDLSFERARGSEPAELDRLAQRLRDALAAERAAS